MPAKEQYANQQNAGSMPNYPVMDSADNLEQQQNADRENNGFNSNNLMTQSTSSDLMTNEQSSQGLNGGKPNNFLIQDANHNTNSPNLMQSSAVPSKLILKKKPILNLFRFWPFFRVY